MFFFPWQRLKSMVLDWFIKSIGLGQSFQCLCGSETVWKRGSFELVHLGGDQDPASVQFYAMEVLWHAEKF